MTMGFKIVSEGQFDEAIVRDFLYDKPASYPACSGTRTYKDNVSDLKAAIAANQKGVQLINSLVEEYSLPIVHFYMDAIKSNAEIYDFELDQEDMRRLGALDKGKDGSMNWNPIFVE